MSWCVISYKAVANRMNRNETTSHVVTFYVKLPKAHITEVNKIGRESHKSTLSGLIYVSSQ
jgi:hypothetical protein